jgi:hypothetical protein
VRCDQAKQGLALGVRPRPSSISKDSLESILTKFLIEQYGGQVSIISTGDDGVTVRLSFPSERIIRSGG